MPGIDTDPVQVIELSHCSDIQAAIAMGEANGLTVADLDPVTIEAVFNLVATADSMGAEAGAGTPNK